MTNVAQYTIPARYLPLPTPRSIPGHKVIYSHDRGPDNFNTTRPLRLSPVSSHPRVDPTTQLAIPRTEAEIVQRFNCSCGANPLNDPHNLAYLVHPRLARAIDPPVPQDNRPAPKPDLPLYPTLSPVYTFQALGSHKAPVRSQAYMKKLVDKRNPRILNHFHTQLFETLPPALQEYLMEPTLSNFRHVVVTDPASPVRDIIARHFPQNYHERPAYAVKQDADYGNDLYNTDEWEAWEEIHRQDQVIMAPMPYVKAAYVTEQRILRESGQPRWAGKYHIPGVDLTHRHPALPVLSDPSGLSESVTNSSRVIEYYEAFVGRTVSRALEVPTVGWQEPIMGRHILHRYGLIHPRRYEGFADGLHDLTQSVL